MKFYSFFCSNLVNGIDVTLRSCSVPQVTLKDVREILRKLEDSLNIYRDSFIFIKTSEKIDLNFITRWNHVYLKFTHKA